MRPIEFCRECRDERDVVVPAEFILWGKLLPKEALGPRCYDHTAKWIKGGMSRIDQYAVFDLRPYNDDPRLKLSEPCTVPNCPGWN